MTKFNIEQLKEKMSGKHYELMGIFLPRFVELRTKKSGGPCVWCGGEDRANLDKQYQDTGIYWCRQCSPKGLDFIDCIQKETGKEVSEIKTELWEYFGIRREVTPKEDLYIIDDEAILNSIRNDDMSILPNINSTDEEINSIVKRGITDSTARPDMIIVDDPQTFPEVPDNPSSIKVNYIRKIYGECVQDHPRLEAYLKHRGLSGASPEDVRLHPALNHKVREELEIEPTLFGVMRNIKAEIVSGQRIFLDNNSDGKSPLIPNKMIMPHEGTVAGCAVRLGWPSEKLCIAEGIETSLAVMELTEGTPTWATVTSSLMKTVVIPESVKEVFIFADNDKAGLEAAHELGSRLKQDVKILIPKNNDWLDDLNEFGSKALEGATIVKPESKVELFKPFLESRSLLDYVDEKISMPNAIIQGVINEGELIVLSGPPKLGKSLIVGNMAYCATLGISWLGFDVPKPRKVLYLQRELGDAWMQLRISKMHAGYQDEKYLDQHYQNVDTGKPHDPDYTLLKNMHIPKPVNFKLDDEADMINLTNHIVEGGFELVIIDPLYCMIKGNENDTQDMSKVLDHLLKLKIDAKVSIILVHHFGKGTGTAKGAHAHRGSSVIGGGSDGNITFKAFDDPELIHQNGLHGKPHEFGFLEFEMRNAAPHDGMIVQMNTTHLIWEKCKKGSGTEWNKQKENTGESPLLILARCGEAMPQKELIAQMMVCGWSAESTCARVVKKKVLIGDITENSKPGHSTAKLLGLPEWEAL